MHDMFYISLIIELEVNNCFIELMDLSGAQVVDGCPNYGSECKTIKEGQHDTTWKRKTM